MWGYLENPASIFLFWDYRQDWSSLSIREECSCYLWSESEDKKHVLRVEINMAFCPKIKSRMGRDRGWNKQSLERFSAPWHYLASLGEWVQSVLQVFIQCSASGVGELGFATKAARFYLMQNSAVEQIKYINFGLPVCHIWQEIMVFLHPELL